MTEAIVIDFARIEKEYGTDLEKASTGIWKDIALIPGMKIKIAQSGNAEYKKKLRAAYKPFARMMQAGQELPQEKEDEIQNMLIAKTLLKDWSGVPGVGGKEVPFNYENVMALLGNKALKMLREEILQYADDFASFKMEFEAEAKKK